MKIIIDSGHGGKDPGAAGFGIKEKDLNLIFAKLLGAKLEKFNVEVDKSLINDKYYTPKELTRKIVESGADLCISCHNNSFNGKAKGFEVIHSIHSEGKLAKLIANEVKKTGFLVRRTFSRESTAPSRVGQDYYYIIRDTYPEVKTIIIEFGFIDNREDFNMLTDAVWQDKLTRAVVEGVKNYYSLEQKDKPVPSEPSSEHWAMESYEELRKAGLLVNDHRGTFDEPATKGVVFTLVNNLRKEIMKNE